MLVFFGMQLTAIGQTTVTVRTTGNTTQSHSFNQSGGIYFNNGQMEIRSDHNTSAATYATAEVKSLRFSGNSAIESADKPTHLKVSPNPAKETVTIEGIGKEPQTLTLYTINGNKVMCRECTDGSTLDISSLPQGIYIVKTGTNTAKIVKY